MKTQLPSLAEVIAKIKDLKELNAEEEFVYYTQIENISKEEVERISANSLQTSKKSAN